ncbi:hypothetical protein NDN08_001558 [Rhodosorus marinus]|uniref:Aminotransferase class I/classII large domain-containing protein n=1 Tax=Rhodosorus marinus TaxID=101924 RepID=A0AAV8UR73_9RHOD|nr:hypothetical protein NDN08_001558 [Rhodosorus marinus]
MRCKEFTGPAPAMASDMYATLDDLDVNAGEVIEDVEFREVVPALSAMRTSNKIREIFETLTSSKTSNDEGKAVISLSIGDPTTHGNLVVSEKATRAVADAVMSGMSNGYAPSTGLRTAREAVARLYSDPKKDVHVEPDDVILTSGCSHALQMTITALVDPSRNQNVLVPRPGFPLYNTIAEHVGVEIREYPLDPDRDWEVDLAALDGLIDSRTAAVLINNPSNPCGSVYSETHLEEIASICRKRQVPIIADEIYNGFCFAGLDSPLMGSLRVKTPIISVGGISKKYLVPGWRLGWLVIHDVDNALKKVRMGLERLATLIVGPNSIVQTALPKILANVDEPWFQGVVGILEDNASFVYERLKLIPGIKAVRPQGSMFMLVNVRGVNADDLTFARDCFDRQRIIVLPGTVFGVPGYVRITFSAPREVLMEACDRLKEYCEQTISAQGHDAEMNGSDCSSLSSPSTVSA